MSLLDHNGNPFLGPQPRFVVVGNPSYEWSTYAILDWAMDNELLETAHGASIVNKTNQKFMLKLCAWMNSLPAEEIYSYNQCGVTDGTPRDYFLRQGTEFYGPACELDGTP